MGEYWLEPIDDAERRTLYLLCPFCRDECGRFEAEPVRWDDDTVVHLYRRGGYEVCVKSEAAGLVREAVREALSSLAQKGEHSENHRQQDGG